MAEDIRTSEGISQPDGGLQTTSTKMSGAQRDQPTIFYTEEVTMAKQILIQQKRDHSMSDILFHVYDKKSEVVAHTLTVEELEDMLKNEQINTSKHEIVPVWEPPYDEISQ